LIPGEKLHQGAYTIEERLSAGGQATAYLAKTTSNKQVVLKEFILAISFTSGALLESAREFETEVTLLSQLNHPGIVKLEDFFTEEGRVYVVLEYVPGRTLRQKVQQDGPLSENAVVDITNKICEVLEYLHSLDPPIVHRDVTPENILILPDGNIKLIDFSLAVKTDGASTTDSCGKQAFTPPEQFRDEICPASDIYGLGATMYFMLTGVPPKPITASSPRKKCANISEKLNSIVERATQLELSQRYDSIKWVKLDLAKISADMKLSVGSEVTR
jgi:serine/threonine protein kinase